MKVIQSDHIPIFTWFDIKWDSNTYLSKNKQIIYNFKDKDGIMKFKELTSKQNLSSKFKDGHILEESRLWLKTLKNILHKSL